MKTLSSIALATLAAAGVPASGATTADVVAPDRMPRVATVDDRFQSYNIEMVEVTGGVFWKFSCPRHHARSSTSSRITRTGELDPLHGAWQDQHHPRGRTDGRMAGARGRDP
jgi:hypothetical protein